MLAIDLIRSSLTESMQFAECLLRDMEDDAHARTCDSSGQTPYWIAGHLAVSEGAVLDQYLLGRPSRYKGWERQFGIGTAPANPAGDDPSYADLLAALVDVRAATLEFVGTLTDADLDRPCHDNDWPGPTFDCVGRCLNALGLHTGIHAGQVACARRATGRPPLFAFDVTPDGPAR